jgi:UDP-galactopyranose mutase
MKIHPVGAELFHTDRRTDVMNLIALFLAISQMQLKRQNVKVSGM